jgi:hypothetical protein
LPVGDHGPIGARIIRDQSARPCVVEAIEARAVARAMAHSISVATTATLFEVRVGEHSSALCEGWEPSMQDPDVIE